MLTVLYRRRVHRQLDILASAPPKLSTTSNAISRLFYVNSDSQQTDFI